MLSALGMQGRGFGESAIVQTVFIDTNTGLNSLMHDLSVVDLTIGGITQPIVPVTGRVPLAVVNPQTGQVLYRGDIRRATGPALTSWGYAIESGVVNGTPVALVSAVAPEGFATASHVFAVVDLTDPANPVALGTLTLPVYAQAVHDIVLKGSTTYVGTESGTYAVSLTDLTQPTLVSTIASVGGRLAFSQDNLLFGSAKSTTLLQHALGGLRSTILGRLALIDVGPPIFSAIDRRTATPEWVTVRPATIRARLLPKEQVTTGSLTLRIDGQPLTTLVQDAAGEIVGTIPANTRIRKGALAVADVVFNTSDKWVTAGLSPISFGGIELILDTNNDTKLEDADVAAHDDDKSKVFTFWQARRTLPGQTPKPTDLEDAATIRLRVSAPFPDDPVRIGFPFLTQALLSLTEKVGKATGYLRDQTTADRQRERFARSCALDRGPEIGSCIIGDRRRWTLLVIT